MEGIRQYIISIITAAVLIGILSSFFRKGSVFTSPFALITGIYMVLTLLQPITGFRLGGINWDSSEIYTQTQIIIEKQTLDSKEQMKKIITEQVRTYIQNKATSMGLVLQIEVTISDGDPPVPWSVHLRGSVSPREREILEAYILDSLAITGERVLWN